MHYECYIFICYIFNQFGIETIGLKPKSTILVFQNQKLDSDLIWKR